MTGITIEVVNSTPLLVGWYDPNLVDPLGLRTTEIKGIWRWWARAIIGGVLYDEGVLVGVSEGKVVKRPSREEVRLVSYYVGKVLGLGYAGPQGSESSRFIVRTETLSSHLIRRMREEARRSQRPNLLALAGSGREYVPEDAKFRITVQIRSRYGDGESLALKILILALQLSGVGKGSRRGLGSLDVTGVTSLGIRMSYELKEFLDEVYEDASNIVRKYGEGLSSKLVRSRNDRALPPLPVVSKSVIEGINVSGIYVVRGGRNLQDLFHDIRNFFVRSERCRKLYNNRSVCDDELRLKQQAWILGLPRIEIEGVDRRASPLMVSCHSERNIFGGGVFVTITVSGDWPRRLKWLNRGNSKNINVGEADIVSATTTAIKEFKEYVRKSGYALVKVWP